MAVTCSLTSSPQSLWRRSGELCLSDNTAIRVASHEHHSTWALYSIIGVGVVCHLAGILGRASAAPGQHSSPGEGAGCPGCSGSRAGAGAGCCQGGKQADAVADQSAGARHPGVYPVSDYFGRHDILFYKQTELNIGYNIEQRDLLCLHTVLLLSLNSLIQKLEKSVQRAILLC